MLRKLFEEKVYVKVSRNRFEIMKVSGKPVVEIVCAPEPFSTSRLLIGEFVRAEHELLNGIKKVLPKKLIKRSPAVLMHPIEMTEGGLSEVEVKVLREVAFGAGAHRVELWEGEELSPQQALEKLENV
ncbi:hypothetical protein [Marinobacter sp. 2_MG-2023]|uniref:hypothetical protein n=1 Tax=Marinobacter sp. 2_MG-2023 TaxID=3062679 RepID=UPI0026E49262|nr:hypothetical protein [Marinobacter sp. 2_MG-2023]MDO6442876.1 hypothetical protein [Marinobacter sp. 2_MG-2023]